MSRLLAGTLTFPPNPWVIPVLNVRGLRSLQEDRRDTCFGPYIITITALGTADLARYQSPQITSILFDTSTGDRWELTIAYSSTLTISDLPGLPIISS
jgi:hypothetical protein